MTDKKHAGWIMQFHLDQVTALKLAWLANFLGKTVCELINEAVIQYVNRKETTILTPKQLEKMKKDINDALSENN